jgi:hypothetical protein
VSAFECWNDALEVAEQYKRLERLGIDGGDVGDTTALPESSMLGADSAVIEACYSRPIPADGLAPGWCAPPVSPLQQPYRH